MQKGCEREDQLHSVCVRREVTESSHSKSLTAQLLNLGGDVSEVEELVT